MDHLIHTTCADILSTAFTLSASTVEGGDMGISIAWDEWEGGTTSREVGDRMIRGLVEGLMELLQLKDLEANVIWTL